MSSTPPFHETLDLTLCGSMGRVHRLCRDAVTLAVEPLGLTQSSLDRDDAPVSSKPRLYTTRVSK